MAETGKASNLHLGMALAASASGVAVSAAGWAYGALHLVEAAVGTALAVLVGFAISTPWRRDIEELASRARSIGEEDPDPQPAARRTQMGADIARALIESRRRVNRMQRALEERSVTGERVLDAAPEPLIVIDIRQQISHANRAAETAFGGDLTGRALVEVVRSPELLDAAESVLSYAQVEATVELESAGGGGRTFRAIVGRLEKVGGAGEAAVIAFQDLTAIRRLEAMRADFVANASHELRTPLTSLVGFIETLEGAAENDATARKRFLGIMRGQASRMTRVVEDLLSLSRIEMEEHAPPGVTADPVQLIRSVIEQLAPVAAARNAEIRLDASGPLPPVAGEPDLLQQVFRNLLENAIKYGPEGGRVVVAAGSHDGYAQFAIADEGDGIPSEHIPRLTERFYRVDVARSRNMGGTGLGLAIVKHILNRCGGGLKISSRMGEGSTFTVSLPPPSPDDHPVSHY